MALPSPHEAQPEKKKTRKDCVMFVHKLHAKVGSQYLELVMIWTDSPPNADMATHTGINQFIIPSILSPRVCKKTMDVIGQTEKRIK